MVAFYEEGDEEGGYYHYYYFYHHHDDSTTTATTTATTATAASAAAAIEMLRPRRFRRRLRLIQRWLTDEGHFDDLQAEIQADRSRKSVPSVWVSVR